jgi:2-dehydropantoate 2-reductase
VRIAVFGAGGAGGYFGARLIEAGEEVAFIARGAHLDAIRRDGLRVATDGGELRVRPAQATDDPAEVRPVDVVLLGVKAWQVSESAQALRPMVGPETAVVPLQNGVEAAGQLADVLGQARVLGGLCGTLSWVAGPGRIRSVGATHFVRVGELDRTASDRSQRIRDALRRGGVDAEVVPDVHAALWRKLQFVTAFGGVGAVTRAPLGVIRQLPDTRRLLEACMRETLAVARARGIALADQSVAEGMAFLDGLAPEGTTSLQRDVASGKPSELEAWNGAVVRLGREAGVPAPTHAFLYASLLPLERRARGEIVFPE